MSTQAVKDRPVSANNPCPFLRALVARGDLADEIEPLGRVAAVIAETARLGDGAPELPAAAIAGIALIANGLGPLSLLQAARHGLHLNRLRDGPLDKKGVGSGILDSQGKVSKTELARLGGFASPQRAADGSTEPGLNIAALRELMDANFERAAGHRRHIDRALMNGEWPVLLKVMGKDGADGRYLSLAEVETLFTKRRLPARMMHEPAHEPAHEPVRVPARKAVRKSTRKPAPKPAPKPASKAAR